MEESKTKSLNKMLTNCNENPTHSPAKKFGFDNLNDSFNDLHAAKRTRLSVSSVETSMEADSNTSLNATTNSLPQSSWEIRCLKADLIETKAKVIKLKQEMERQQKLKKESEDLLEKRVEELKKQCEYSTNKVQEMEKRVRVTRKRENAVKEDLLKAQNEMQQQKIKYDESIMKLRKSKMEIQTNSREIQNTLTIELNEAKQHEEELEAELELSNEQLENLKIQLDEHKAYASTYGELKLEYDKVLQDLEIANSQIKKLEYEISSYTDWKKVMENFQNRLTNIPEMLKEIEYLRSNNKNLQKLIDNKLLLEEQVFDLRSRLEKEENNRDELISLRIQLKQAQEELNEWSQLARDHCPSSAHLVKVGPLLLRSRIEELLQNDVVMATERHTNVNETNSITMELFEVKQQNEIYAKNLQEVNMALKRHKIFKERVQKKLLLVSKERDVYKQLLDNFEKDLSLSTTNTGDSNTLERNLRQRIDMLEKTVVGYKEMCASMEKELTAVRAANQTKDLADEQATCTPIDITSNIYEDFKKQFHSLRMENERLSRRKEELELKLEQFYLRDGMPAHNYKILDVSDNPADEACQNIDNQIFKLQSEIERLKQHHNDNEAIGLSESLNGSSQAGNMIVNIKEMIESK